MTTLGLLVVYRKFYKISSHKIGDKEALTNDSDAANNEKVLLNRSHCRNVPNVSDSISVGQISPAELEYLVSLLSTSKTIKFSKIMKTLVHLSNHNVNIVFANV